MNARKWFGILVVAMALVFGTVAFRTDRAPLWVVVLLTVSALGAGAGAVYVLFESRFRKAEQAERGLVQEVGDLRREVRRGWSVLDGTPNGVISVDCEGRITLCNQSSERMLGVRARDLVGRKIEDVDLHPELARLVYECIASHTALSIELKLPGWPMRVLLVRAISIGKRPPRILIVRCSSFRISAMFANGRWMSRNLSAM